MRIRTYTCQTMIRVQAIILCCWDYIFVAQFVLYRSKFVSTFCTAFTN
jgi:hypothetical protein